MFPSLEVRHSFYYLYVSRVVFDVRKSSQKIYVNKANDVREVDLKLYVYNKEGLWSEKLVSNHHKQGSLYLSQKVSDDDECPLLLRNTNLVHSDTVVRHL